MNMWKALPPVVGVTAAVLLAGCGTDPRTPAVETQTVTVAAAPGTGFDHNGGCRTAGSGGREG